MSASAREALVAGPAGSKARVLVVDDDAAFRASLCRELSSSGYRVSEAANGAQMQERLLAGEPEVVLLDLRLASEDGLSLLQHVRSHASSEVIMLTGHGSVPSAIRALKMGAADYLQKPCDLDELELAIERALETRRLKERNVILERGLVRPGVEMIGRSPAFLQMTAEIDRAAQSLSNVLVVGESGTGKELVARRLHQASPTREKPLVVVDCASLSDELMHSELFGHEKGAFTGAVERKHGLFEVADGGTICLDEVGEVTPRVQAKLLRVLESGTFRRMGGTSEIQVHVRVLSATNRRLEEAVKAGTFREDLYYRLVTLQIRVPPLRERREDIPLLAAHFLARASRGREAAPTLDAEATRALCAYDWPGNIRELIGVAERLVTFGGGRAIGRAEIERCVCGPAQRPQQPAGEEPTLAEMERRQIESVMQRCNGHRAEAARILGLSERTLYRKLQALRLRERR
ncbi:MAG TPA: sigma-54 dependent transcriptional regulator [Myxococcales bacterium]